MKFTDNEDCLWNIKMNMGILQEIEDYIPGFSSEIVKDVHKMINLLWTDNEKVVGILWIILEEQATAKGLNPRTFARRFDRDVLNRAVDALLSEFVSFFQYGPISDKVKESFPGMLEKLKTQMRTITDNSFKEASLKLDTALRESRG